jgi:hypothetical protein
MNGTPPSLEVQEAIGSWVERFTCAITLLPSNDERVPPGDHHGTGSLFDVGGRPHLITCEHVAVFQTKGTLGYSRYGAEDGTSVGGLFQLHPYPIDFAIASVAATWDVVPHDASCIPESVVARRHDPIEGELLYVYGFPGSESIAAFGGHFNQGVGILCHEAEYNPILQDELPKPLPEKHFFLSCDPEHAKLQSGRPGALAPTPGLSGSLVWNTRYHEKVSRGEVWTPSDMRVTGIVWGSSSKAGLLVATPVECWRGLIGLI